MEKLNRSPKRCICLPSISHHLRRFLFRFPLDSDQNSQRFVPLSRMMILALLCHRRSLVRHWAVPTRISQYLSRYTMISSTFSSTGYNVHQVASYDQVNTNILSSLYRETKEEKSPRPLLRTFLWGCKTRSQNAETKIVYWL